MTGAEQLTQRGIQQGADQRNYEIACGMIAEGLEVTIIERLTKLPAETIIKLQREINHDWQNK